MITLKIVSSKVFFDVCPPFSPGAVRSDFDMKAQSFSDPSFFLPASLPPLSVYCLRNFQNQAGALHVTQRERSLGAVPCSSLLSSPVPYGIVASVGQEGHFQLVPLRQGLLHLVRCVSLHRIAQETPWRCLHEPPLLSCTQMDPIGKGSGELPRSATHPGSRVRTARPSSPLHIHSADGSCAH